MNSLDDGESCSGKYALIAPCIEEGVSLAQRAREIGVHRSTLARLKKRFKALGAAGLERKKRSDRDSAKVGVNLTEIIKAHLIALPHLSCSTIQRMVARICLKQEWKAPTYWSIYRIHKKLPPDLLTLSKDSAEYKRLYELIHRFEASCPNEIWQADHNFMDIFVWDQFGQALKPVLTVILDDYSRAVAGYHLDFVPPSAQRRALALRQAIWHKKDPQWLVYGIPDKLYTDRGADFVSKRLKQISAELCFELIKGRPYHPQGKGKIERFFETVNQLFLCELSGYTPEGTVPKQPGLTLDQLQKSFHAWLIDEYMQKKHEETGQAPLIRWSERRQVPRMPESLDKLHLLLMSIPDHRTVRKDGVHILNNRYFSTELQNGYMRESVLVRYDPADISQVYIFHENEFVCIATCGELAGTRPSYDDVKNARTARVKFLRTIISSAKGVVKTFAHQSGRAIPPAETPSPPPQKPTQTIRRYTVDP
ncbi:MAG: Mu transposase C-terminal domain-containing protein [Ktedonobacteraceae bacterium]